MPALTLASARLVRPGVVRAGAFAPTRSGAARVAVRNRTDLGDQSGGGIGPSEEHWSGISSRILVIASTTGLAGTIRSFLPGDNTISHAATSLRRQHSDRGGGSVGVVNELARPEQNRSQFKGSGQDELPAQRHGVGRPSTMQASKLRQSVDRYGWESGCVVRLSGQGESETVQIW